MNLIKTDIDKLLDATTELEEDVGHLLIYNFEIDLLLESTEDW